MIAGRELLHSFAESTWAPLGIFAVARVVGRIVPRGWRIPWRVLSVLIGAVVLAAATAYLMTPVLFEDAESDIASIAAVAMRGAPLYPAMDAAGRYALLYGPWTYLAHIPLFWILGSNLVAFKALGFLSLMGTSVGLYAICRRYAPPSGALVGWGCAQLVLFRYLGVEYWGRIDPLILVLVVAGVWASVSLSPAAALVVNAVAIAVIPDLKASGVMYLLPLVALLAVRQGWKIAGGACVVGAVLLPVPFLLPNVSVPNYVAVLRAAAVHGLVPEFAYRNLQYCGILLLPAVVISAGRWRKMPALIKVYGAAIVVGLLGTSLLGAKSGAGSYHLLPFVPPLLHLTFWIGSEWDSERLGIAFRPWAIAWVLTMLALSDHHVRTVLHEMRYARGGAQALDEIREAEQTYRGRTLAVGVGDTFDDPRTRYGYDPVFRGQPFTVNGAAVRDLQFSGVPIPEATIRTIESCATEVWMIPRDQQPFAAGNSYYERFHPAFEDRFRQAFLARYEKHAAGTLYDVWTCRR